MGKKVGSYIDYLQSSWIYTFRRHLLCCALSAVEVLFSCILKLNSCKRAFSICIESTTRWQHCYPDTHYTQFPEYSCILRLFFTCTIAGNKSSSSIETTCGNIQLEILTLSNIVTKCFSDNSNNKLYQYLIRHTNFFIQNFDTYLNT